MIATEARKKDLNSIEARAEFITYAKSLVKSIENKELQNQYLNLIAERFDTNRSLNGVKSIKPQRAPKAPASQPQPNPELAEYGVDYSAPVQEQVRVPWEILSPIEIRFANLLFHNPTLLDRASEYFDMEFAASGIQLLESSLIDEFVNTIIANYAETGYFSAQLLYEQLSPTLQLFLENLPEESWTPPKEIIEFYETLMVLTQRLCDRTKKQISLSTQEGMEQRLRLNQFTQGMQKLETQYKKGSLSIDGFADQIIKSKQALIQILAATKG
jgi:DNA primase